MAGPDDDPFAVLDRLPAVAGGDAVPDGAVGGGWFGWLGYRLGARVERVPPGPPRPVPMPEFHLAYYDHVLRRDADGRWWFEALATEERRAELDRRLAHLRGAARRGRRRSRPMRRRSVAAAAEPRGRRPSPEAIAACRARIAAGEIFQANLCVRLDGTLGRDGRRTAGAQR